MWRRNITIPAGIKKQAETWISVESSEICPKKSQFFFKNTLDF
jgi:hypothetical protein